MPEAQNEIPPSAPPPDPDEAEIKEAGRVFWRFLAVVVLVLIAAFATSGWSPVPLPVGTCRISKAEVTRAWCGFEKEGRSLSRLVATPTNDRNEQARLAAWRPGTVVNVCNDIATVDPGGHSCSEIEDVTVRRAFRPAPKPDDVFWPEMTTKLMAGVAAAGAVALYAWILAGLKWPRWKRLVRHDDGRAYSLSRIQAVLWIVGLLWMWHLYAFIRLWSGMPWLDAFAVTIPEPVMGVLGSSVATAIAAGVVDAKAAQDPKAAPDAKALAASKGLIADLLINDGKIDLLRAQAAILSSAAFVWYLSNLWNGVDRISLTGQMDLPAMDSVLALVFGTSLGGYLLSKFTPPPKKA